MISGSRGRQRLDLIHVLKKAEAKRLASCLTAEQGKKAILLVCCIQEMPRSVPAFVPQAWTTQKGVS